MKKQRQKMIDLREVGRRLKGLREELTYKHNIDATQYLLADSIQIHRTAYNAVENGRGAMSKEALVRLIEFYRGHGIHASLDWIIMGIDHRKAISKSESDKDIEIAKLRKDNKQLGETLDAQNKMINMISQ